MSPATSLVEDFLIAFHDQRPGLTSKAFGSLPVVCRGRAFASSYAVLADVVPRVPTNIEVLDLACGDGHLLSLLASRAQRGLALSGIDMSSSELAVARSRIGNGVDLRQVKAQGLPFASSSFDCVLCHLALMLMDNIEQVVGEVHRVLRPGSRFEAIVGAAPPPSFALTAYIEALSKRSRLPHMSAVHFGDRRLSNREGILEVLAPAFHSALVEDIHISQLLTPEQIWHWFLDMYDLYLLSEADRRLVEQDFLSTASSECGPEGTLEFPQTLRFACATAA